jgi:predicted acylesterase/phospholipase RssA
VTATAAVDLDVGKAAAMRECDLIMKGGITSGVVYPYAITELAKTYRLRSVGGSSAGAIAATLAAAAERRRQVHPGEGAMSGFQEVEAIAEVLARDMTKLLQPAPTFAGLFRLLLAAVSDPKGGTSKFWGLLGVAASVWRGPLWIGGGVVLAGLILALVSSDAGWLFFGALAGPLATAALVGLDLHRLIFRALREHRFGILPGLRQEGGEGPGLTDWLADKIDIVAGNLGPDGRPGAPLTVGQLEEAGVEIAAMTTDLTSQRPYQLPLRSADHFFSRADFEALFPARVIAHLVGEARALDARDAGGPSDLYPMRIGADFPVLLVARLSLSFPGLIQAIPLWRRDWQLKTGAGDAGLWRRCMFSDGGISSNLPVHLFDTWLPRRPTFAISLTAWDRDRHGDERVHLPKVSTQSTNLPTLELRRLGAFLFAILNAAKDWQDTLQRNLPGFAERTVEIRLDETKEGGMNLTMEREVIERLGELGREAGRRLVADFDLDENRWRRAMSVLPELENGLEAFAEAWREAPVGTAAMPYETLLTDYDQKTITAATKTWRRQTLAPFARRLAELGDQVAAARAGSDRETVQDGPRPGQDASMRLLADADRRPRSRHGAGSGANV